QRVGAVLQFVGLLDARSRQLAGLADRYEPRAQTLCHRAAQDEATALDADDQVNGLIGVRRREPVDRGLEPLRLAEERRDVVEEDACLREVWNVSDVLFEVHSVSSQPGVTENVSYAPLTSSTST